MRFELEIGRTSKGIWYLNLVLDGVMKSRAPLMSGSEEKVRACMIAVNASLDIFKTLGLMQGGSSPTKFGVEAAQ